MNTSKHAIGAILSLAVLSGGALAATQSLTIVTDSFEEDAIESPASTTVLSTLDSVFMEYDLWSMDTQWLASQQSQQSYGLDEITAGCAVQSCFGDRVPGSFRDLIRSEDAEQPVITMPMTLSLRFDH